MVKLRFSLTPEAAAKLHDMLSCLAKFSDTVSLEARLEQISLSSLNSSKSGYSSFLLNRNFFESYKFIAERNGRDTRFTCSILNKALMSVFKARIIDIRGRDTAIERCDVQVQDSEDQAECRLIIKMICAHGVTKTYHLTYESTEVVHALFDRNTANNRWSTRATFLKEFSEYFSPKAEQLDIYLEDGKVTFLSFTDKIVNSKNEILKNPLKTAVSVNTADFDQFEAQERLHIIISVKDFKTIVTHAATFNANITAYYSNPGRPLQFTYTQEGLTAQFTLMTAGDGGATPTASAAKSAAPSRTISRAPSMAGTATANIIQDDTSIEMPPPTKPAARRPSKKLGQKDTAVQSKAARQSAEDADSLFVPADDDDARWEPTDHEKDEESMGWDASVTNASIPRCQQDTVLTAAKDTIGFQPTFRDTQSFTRSHSTEPAPEGLPPTQRISQIKGLW